MKKSILLYLFILAVLMNVFTYMYFSKRYDAAEKDCKAESKKMNDSLTSLTSKLAEADYFSLENNQLAQDYFANDEAGTYITPSKLIPFVSDKLMDFNSDPNGNPYTGFDKFGDKKFIINKIKLLNHRWIIANFSNGEIWGEAVIKYFLNEDGTVSFERAESLIYPKESTK